MNKKSICIVIIIVAVMLPTSVIYSNDKEVINDLSRLDIDFEVDKGQEGRSMSETKQLLLEQGVSNEDATFLSKMDIFATQLEKQNIMLDFSKVDDVSTTDLKANLKYYREKALEGDLPSLKALYKQKGAITDKTLVQSAMKELNDSSGTLTVNYSDGSKAIITTKDEYLSEADSDYLPVPTHEPDSVQTSSTRLVGPWFKFSQVSQGPQAPNSGNRVASNTQNFVGGTHWSTVKAMLYYTLYNNGYATDYSKWSVRYTKTDGNAVSSGDITIAARDYDNHINETASATQFISGFARVVFEANASFGGSVNLAILDLSVSVSAGKSWEQFSIIEIQGRGYPYFYVGM